MRVVVADDDEDFAAVVATVLGHDPRIKVVGRARDGAEAIELARKLEPDVVLMDIDMPVVDGVEATRAALRLTAPPAVIVVSGSDDRAREARLAGAVEYVPKGRLDEKLLGGVSRAAQIQARARCTGE